MRLARAPAAVAGRLVAGASLWECPAALSRQARPGRAQRASWSTAKTGTLTVLRRVEAGAASQVENVAEAAARPQRGEQCVRLLRHVVLQALQLLVERLCLGVADQTAMVSIAMARMAMVRTAMVR